MTTKHLPHYAPDADRIVFDGDGSVWVRADSFVTCVECAMHADDWCELMEFAPGTPGGCTWGVRREP